LRFGSEVEDDNDDTDENYDDGRCHQVQIVGGALLHSKKGGDGYVDTSDKMNKIIAGVEAALA
jgi:hypothetical protein